MFVQSCYITLITHTSFTFYLTDEMKHKKATTGAHPIYTCVYIIVWYTMKNNNKITSWKIYLVKKMTHIRSDIIMYAYNFCLLLFYFFALIRIVGWYGKIYMLDCMRTFFFSHKNGVKWYMTGRMFCIYCDYYIFLSFGYYYCLMYYIKV